MVISMDDIIKRQAIWKNKRRRGSDSPDEPETTT